MATYTCFKRWIATFACSVVAYGPALACTQYEELPGRIDPSTVAADLPCVRRGVQKLVPASVVLYHHGDLIYFDTSGKLHDQNGFIMSHELSWLSHEIQGNLLTAQGNEGIAYLLTDVIH